MPLAWQSKVYNNFTSLINCCWWVLCEHQNHSCVFFCIFRCVYRFLIGIKDRSSQITNQSLWILNCAASDRIIKNKKHSWLLCGWGPFGLSNRLVWLHSPFSVSCVRFTSTCHSARNWSRTTPECCSVSLFPYLKSSRQFKALRSTIWFFCDACHKLQVDIYYLARSGVDIIETGWSLSLEKRM
jgi:hypothetical protein